jgi:hypothetical protein
MLIDAARHLVPDYVINAPKRGFSPPAASWVSALRNRHSRDLVRGALVQNRILDAAAAERIAAPGSRFGADYDMFQKFLVLEFWYRGMQEVVRNAQGEGKRFERLTTQLQSQPAA